MNDLLSMNELMGSLNGLKQNVEATRLSLMYFSSRNKNNLSLYHAEFDKLLKKYAGFAEEYSGDLNNFNKKLSNKLYELQQETLEIISNSSNSGNKINDNIINNNNNNEVIDNSPNIDYSSAVSSPNNNNNINMEKRKETKSDEEEETETDNSSNASNTEKEPTPKPKVNKVNKVNKVKLSVNKQQQRPVQQNNKRKIAQQNKNKINNNMKSTTPKTVNNNKRQQQKIQKVVSKPVKMAAIKEEKTNDLYSVYKYDEKSINFEAKFKQNGIKRSSTMIFIGNLPKYIKVAAVQFFVMKQFKITMRQVEETKIMNGLKSNYALVRIRNDVSIEKITKLMNEINNRNTREFEESKKKISQTKNNKNNKNNKNKKDDKETIKKQKSSNGPKSWQRKIYINFNNTFKYYETEEEMYNDSRAKSTLFVRNFDILNKKCHKELTDIFISFGNLTKDIIIKTDYFNDPYAMITFNNIDDAIYCCNSVINFYGRTLEMKYDQYARN